MATINRFVFGIVLCGLLCAVMAASQVNELPKLELNKTRNGSHAGLEPFYDMILIFLNDMVMPKTVGELIEEYDIQSWMDFAEPEFTEHWSDWILYFLGFLLCIVSGILFLVFLPCVGLCYCCCRCCGCGCCSHKPRKQGKNDKYKRICCGTSVFVMTSMMLAAACLLVLTQDFVAHEFKTGQLIGEMKSGVETVEAYLHRTVGDLDKALIQEIEKSVDKTVKILEELPEESLKRLEEEFQLDSMLGELENFVNNMEPLSDAFGQMDNSTEILQGLTTNLESDLTVSRLNLQPMLENCSLYSCDDALVLLDDLTVDATYENMSDVTLAKAALDAAIDIGIKDMVNEGIEAYEDIKIIILNETEEIAQEMIDGLETMEEKIREGYDQLLANITDTNFDEIYDKMDEAGEMTEDIGHYYEIGAACFGGLLMLIVLFAWLGLCCGACCSAPKEGVGSCCSTTTVGSRCLMLSIAFTFIFGSLITLITVITFTAGGATELFLCRHLVTYDETFQSYMEITDQINFDYNITATQLIDDCRNNRSLYVAANLEENGFNLTKLLDLEESGIYDMFDKLANITIEIGNVTILDDAVTAILTNVSSYLDDIDYSTYEDELDKDITKVDIIEYADLLSEIVAELRSGDPSQDYLADDIEAEEDTLRILANTTVKEIEDERDILQDATDAAIEISDSIDLTTLLQNISDAEDKLNEEGLTVVTDYIVEVGDEVLAILEELVAAVEKNIVEEVGNCREIYEMGVSLVYTPCVYFLYPFNSLWFCAGWFLFCCFFHLIFATKSAGLYTHYMSPEEVTFHDRDDLELVESAAVAAPPPDGGVESAAFADPPPDYGDESAAFADPPPDYGEVDTKDKMEKDYANAASGYDNPTYQTDKNAYNPPHYPSTTAMAKYHGVQVLPPYPNK